MTNEIYRGSNSLKIIYNKFKKKKETLNVIGKREEQIKVHWDFCLSHNTVSPK